MLTPLCSNKSSPMRKTYAARVAAVVLAALGENGEQLERMTPSNLAQVRPWFT